MFVKLDSKNKHSTCRAQVKDRTQTAVIEESPGLHKHKADKVESP